MLTLLMLANAAASATPHVAILSHADLVADGVVKVNATRMAFFGDAAYGLLIVKDILGFAKARRAAFEANIQLADFLVFILQLFYRA